MRNMCDYMYDGGGRQAKQRIIQGAYSHSLCTSADYSSLSVIIRVGLL